MRQRAKLKINSNVIFCSIFLQSTDANSVLMHHILWLSLNREIYVYFSHTCRIMCRAFVCAFHTIYEFSWHLHLNLAIYFHRFRWDCHMNRYFLVINPHTKKFELNTCFVLAINQKYLFFGLCLSKSLNPLHRGSHFYCVKRSKSQTNKPMDFFLFIMLFCSMFHNLN